MAEGKKFGFFRIIGILFAIGLIMQACDGNPPDSEEQAEEWAVGTWVMTQSFQGFNFETVMVVKENGKFESYSKRTGTSKNHEFELDKKGSWKITEYEDLYSEKIVYSASFNGVGQWEFIGKKKLEQPAGTFKKKSSKQNFEE